MTRDHEIKSELQAVMHVFNLRAGRQMQGDCPQSLHQLRSYFQFWVSWGYTVRACIRVGSRGERRPRGRVGRKEEGNAETEINTMDPQINVEQMGQEQTDPAWF